MLFVTPYFLLLVLHTRGTSGKQTAALAPAAECETIQPPSCFPAGSGWSSRLTLSRWRGCRAEEMPLNCVRLPEQKASPLEALVVSFLNQGHLFLSGKREMFLKARLSIKIYWLPWRPLTTQDCTLCSTVRDFSLFKGSALSKNKRLCLLFISKFIMGKAINAMRFT